jgi:hypothetical protein
VRLGEEEMLGTQIGEHHARTEVASLALAVAERLRLFPTSGGTHPRTGREQPVVERRTAKDGLHGQLRIRAPWGS